MRPRVDAMDIEWRTSILKYADAAVCQPTVRTKYRHAVRPTSNAPCCYGGERSGVGRTVVTKDARENDSSSDLQIETVVTPARGAEEEGVHGGVGMGW